MIDEAVKTEDYERAAAIRDEIDKRKKRNDYPGLCRFKCAEIKNLISLK